MRLTEADAVLITGGGSGLGAATARRLAGTGAGLVLADLAGSPAAQLAGELGPQVRAVAADVRSEEDVRSAVDAARELGTLRLVVNCAGVATPGRIISKRGVLGLEDFRTVIDINLVGTFNVVRLAAAAMIDNEPADEPGGDRGVMIMTASVAAYDGQIGQAAYAASKGGIAALTITAARDLADKQIRVMTIAPGVMETPMMAGLPGDTKATLEALVPHPARLGRPDEYALLVEQITANPLLNGEVIRLDGALRMPPR
ncbi:NAD(P)-dependent dehydrogenase (short-subunit alcohol dehydrogenase family) [Friedmanniella endophytica]|uniref:NAD(P)-dependent dehydrogenase (Short-subunit alcohol dehydrogenase family) n=1 Tax=Microlunatus kandeliicorticis TaxID=1759536 RepID=A0A7W3P6C8_9ACTN|nr:SDR family NAD(P)-dependent oxidoreductase [Microlunatus kandeliicorticis]MBA8794833.1 NAD(P)-dependent dehydrogenase (short-subunit alcohol dehydrogenase family) [Microlunatus kandeliicorticis]